MPANRAALNVLLAEVRACRVCAAHLEPRPILRAHGQARLLIIGQAPGIRAHASHTPWNDPSGERLRGWLELDRDRFYDEARVAIVPMGFCYPGPSPQGGDRPPRLECAPLWHARIRARMSKVEVTLLVGTYAQAFYLGGRHAGMTETVRAWRERAPFVPLPHPSWRNNGWLERNPWFAAELVPELRRLVARAIGRA